MRWLVLLFGMELPAAMAFVDCSGRPADDFAGGPDDRRSWRSWLIVAMVTAPLLVGNLIVLGYYSGVVRRASPTRF
ncbi:MAG TPA: hypothetical protein VM030_04065 [Acidimicrobiales bacterium]|nr:hypothetical protein [Acidimicrobiales bacterium]